MNLKRNQKKLSMKRIYIKKNKRKKIFKNSKNLKPKFRPTNKKLSKKILKSKIFKKPYKSYKIN